MSLWDKAEPVRDVDLPHTATLHSSSGFDDYNNPITSDLAMDCRFEPMNELFISGSGREERSVAMVFTKTLVTIQDSITFEGEKFPVKKVGKFSHQDGSFSHYEVWL